MTMCVQGKLENVKREMKRAAMKIQGLNELRWEGEEDFMSGEYRVIYSGGGKRQRGVAMILDKTMGERAIKVIQCSERVMLIRVVAEPVDLVLIQVYMPISDSEDEEIEMMCEQIEELIKGGKATDQVIVM